MLRRARAWPLSRPLAALPCFGTSIYDYVCACPYVHAHVSAVLLLLVYGARWSLHPEEPEAERSAVRESTTT